MIDGYHVKSTVFTLMCYILHGKKVRNMRDDYDVPDLNESVESISNKSKKRRTKQQRLPKHGHVTQSVLSDHIGPIGVIGLAVATLGLAVYGVAGGHVERFVENQRPPVVYASDSDQTIVIRPDGSVVQPGDDDYGLDQPNNELIGYTQDEVDELVQDAISQAVVSAEKQSEIEANAKAKAEEESRLKAQQEKMDSLRIRIKPDRDLGDVYYYIVEPGDQLQTLAEHFGIPIGQLMEINYISVADNIYTGEVLFMPSDYSIEQAPSVK